MNVTAYTFDDAVRDLAPRGGGIAALQEISREMEQTSLNTQSDRETEEFMQFLRKTLYRFDFMKLYESPYFTDRGEGFRGISFQGCNRENRYQYGIISSGNNRCGISRPWDFTTEYALKKNDRCIAGGLSFIVSVNSATATARYSHKNALSFAEGLIRVLDPANIRALHAPESEIFGSIEGDSRRVINDFSRIMLNANGGAGSTATFEWDMRNPNNVTLRFSAVSEFMDSYFLQYGLKIWSKIILSDETLQSEMKALTAKFLDAFTADLRIKKN
ncbi:MAG: hypothetical protein A2176_14885 [Spirochaetes bacterium RBG_13_51_14]|nr:MAG: hypothetical protein A2176_14885 [Spirochaetes bacterium RBG_13_51_14]